MEECVHLLVCFSLDSLRSSEVGFLRHKQDGLNKKQAGEDFYFLQKIMPMGNYFELNSTTVHPSSRTSDRVPFGTGPIINQYLKHPDPFESLLVDISIVEKEIDPLKKRRMQRRQRKQR